MRVARCDAIGKAHSTRPEGSGLTHRVPRVAQCDAIERAYSTRAEGSGLTRYRSSGRRASSARRRLAIPAAASQGTLNQRDDQPRLIYLHVVSSVPQCALIRLQRRKERRFLRAEGSGNASDRQCLTSMLLHRRRRRVVARAVAWVSSNGLNPHTRVPVCVVVLRLCCVAASWSPWTLLEFLLEQEQHEQEQEQQEQPQQL